MKEMKIGFLCVLIAAVVFGCSGKNPDNAESIVDIDQFSTYSLDVESSPTSFFDLIESVEILRLEETKKSLLSNFYSIERLGNDFVFGVPKRGEVSIFDEFGNFKRSLSIEGSGPKEVSLMLNTWVEGDTIAVFDAVSLRIQKYDSEGNYLATRRVPPRSPEIAYWNGRYYLDASSGIQDNGDVFGVRIFDKNMQLVGNAIPFAARKPFGVFWRSPFIPYNDELTYHDTIRDTVYVTDKDTFRPLLSIDYGAQWAWRDQSLLLDFGKANAMFSRRGFVNRFQAIVSSEHVFVQNYWSGKIQGHLINRLTGEVQRIKMDKKSKDAFSLVPFRWDGDRLLASLTSTDVAEFIQSTGNENINFREGTTLEAIESSENPALVWIKFK
ncbi:MAG: hypothetical protein ACJAVN_000690 [Roseivirga sp.]|jgi:hypothetical protein